MGVSFGLWGDPDDQELRFARASLADVNAFLGGRHYLGAYTGPRFRFAFVGVMTGEIVAAQVWRMPAARRLPNDGSWLELARWCLTTVAVKNAGSRMHGWVRRWLLENEPKVTTLVSYSDPSIGHSGTLYRACGWRWAPTWLRISPPPKGERSWDRSGYETPKDRWIFDLRPDPTRESYLTIPYPSVRRRYEAMLAEQAA